MILIVFLTTIMSFKCFAQETESFESFFFTYSTDEDFQIERTKFPLEFVTWDNPTIFLQKNRWTLVSH
jgi:hypothetical protein